MAHRSIEHNSRDRGVIYYYIRCQWLDNKVQYL